MSLSSYSYSPLKGTNSLATNNSLIILLDLKEQCYKLRMREDVGPKREMVRWNISSLISKFKMASASDTRCCCKQTRSNCNQKDVFGE